MSRSVNKNLRIKSIPIDKTCRLCGQRKLLSEFDFYNNAKNKRLSTCKSCVEKKDENDEPACCQYHLMITNSYNQLELLLEVVETLQYNKVEIPRELLAKMFRIVHKGDPMSL